MTTLHLGKSIVRSTWRRGSHLSVLALVVAWLAFSPQARAVCQQGCDLNNNNTFLGDDALLNNFSGVENTAIGWEALYRNTTGILNTANGASALRSNTTGSVNTATGNGALYSNTTGSDNTAIGFDALSNNTTASSNTATGHLALVSNTTGYRNTATGESALYNNGAGHGNTAIGFQALYNNSGSNNIALGFNAGNNLTTGSGNVCIGYGVLGAGGESNTTRISNIYASVASGRAVYVNSDNKIGTLVSSRRFKDEIKPMDKASEAILALKPVTFRYKKEIEPNGSVMFGLIAEEVEKVDPDLVTRNDKGEVETVRYEAVNAMLLNEFLKEHGTVQELKSAAAKQDATISQLRSKVAQQQKDFQATVAQLTARLDEQASQIQKVNAQLEVNRPAPQMISNNQ